MTDAVRRSGILIPAALRRRAGFAALAILLGLLGCAAHQPPQASETLRIYLARHGRTDWNAAHRLQGWTDTHLDSVGRAQAAALGRRLHGVHLDAVYSSTLSRSRETAEAARGTAPLTSLDGLRERGLGIFEGLVPESDSLHGAEYRRRTHQPNDSLDGGESQEQFFARVAATLQEIVAAHPSGTILIVGHGGTNQMIVRSLFDLSAAQADSIHQANDELYAIDIAPGAPPLLWKSIPPNRLRDL
jgi:probable phosphoglycerate mutase